MNEHTDPNITADIVSTPADWLDAGLAAGFGMPRSSLGELRPVLLKEAEGEPARLATVTSFPARSLVAAWGRCCVAAMSIWAAIWR